jgi:hypothetical protein
MRAAPLARFLSNSACVPWFSFHVRLICLSPAESTVPNPEFLTIHQELDSGHSFTVLTGAAVLTIMMYNREKIRPISAKTHVSIHSFIKRRNTHERATTTGQDRNTAPTPRHGNWHDQHNPSTQQSTRIHEHLNSQSTLTSSHQHKYNAQTRILHRAHFCFEWKNLSKIRFGQKNVLFIYG